MLGATIYMWLPMCMRLAPRSEIRREHSPERFFVWAANDMQTSAHIVSAVDRARGGQGYHRLQLVTLGERVRERQARE